MEAQKKINELHTQGIQEVKNLLGTLLQSTRNSEAEKSAEPAAKKRKRDDEGVTSETGVGIQLHVQDHERIEDEMVEEDEWNQLNGNGPLGGGIEGEGNHNEASQLDGDGTMSANLGSKYQDLLDQTEEVLGEPINKDLADVVKRVWGKSVLTSEKKKQLYKDLEIPQNCPVLKSPKLNTKVYIRLNENAQMKDKGAQERQKGLSRAVIPLLQGIGDMDKAQVGLQKQYALLHNKEPTTLEEAKKIISQAKLHAKESYESTNDIRRRIQKSVSVLAFAFTQTTKKRKQDVCWALGKEFSAYAQDTRTGEEELFPEDDIKAMKNELKAVKPKGQFQKT